MLEKFEKKTTKKTRDRINCRERERERERERGGGVSLEPPDTAYVTYENYFSKSPEMLIKRFVIIFISDWSRKLLFKSYWLDKVAES